MADKKYRTCTIYGLSASDDLGRIRYIGQTTARLSARLKNHLYDACTHVRVSPVNVWIREVVARGASIGAATLESDADLDIAETWWIDRFKDSGVLLNEKGGGLRGKNSDATKMRMRAAQAIRVKRPEEIERRRQSALAAQAKPDVRERVRAGILASRTPDVVAKTSGSRNGCAKLNEASVRLMRERFASGATTSSLGRQFGVSQTVAWQIVHRKTWRQVA